MASPFFTENPFAFSFCAVAFVESSYRALPKMVLCLSFTFWSMLAPLTLGKRMLLQVFFSLAKLFSLLHSKHDARAPILSWMLDKDLGTTVITT